MNKWNIILIIWIGLGLISTILWMIFDALHGRFRDDWWIEANMFIVNILMLIGGATLMSMMGLFTIGLWLNEANKRHVEAYKRRNIEGIIKNSPIKSKPSITQLISPYPQKKTLALMKSGYKEEV